MHRGSRNLVEPYYNRDISLHKPGAIPNSSRIISPITSNRHKYELKQRIWPKKTVESWFSSHSSQERQAVFSFLDTLYNTDDTHEKDDQRRKSPAPRRVNTAILPRRLSTNSRASKRDLGEVLETLESFRSPSSVEEKSVQTFSTGPLPSLNEANPPRDDKSTRRYHSQTWRVTNPRQDVEINVRPDHNSSSFFNYTKKSYPEYFFIHPDWY